MSMLANKLTKASLGHILHNIEIVEPIVQLIGYKQVPQNDGSVRYRLSLSDGVYIYKLCIVIDVQLKERFANEEFDQFCLVKLKRYSLTTITTVETTNVIIIINELEIDTRGSQVGLKLANPIAFGSPDAPSISNYTPNYHIRHSMEDEFDDDEDDLLFCSLSSDILNNDQNNNAVSSQSKRMKTNYGEASTSYRTNNTLNPNLAGPISSLTQFSFRWIIKGRVISKSEKKTWNKASSNGVLFSFELQDHTDIVKIVVFNHECEKFFDTIEFGRCYLVSKGTIKEPDKKYTNANYEIHLNSESIVEEFDGNHSCPQIIFHFVDFDQSKAR